MPVECAVNDRLASSEMLCPKSCVWVQMSALVLLFSGRNAAKCIDMHVAIASCQEHNCKLWDLSPGGKGPFSATLESSYSFKNWSGQLKLFKAVGDAQFTSIQLYSNYKHCNVLLI